MKKYALLFGLFSCAEPKTETPSIKGEMFFEQNSSEGICWASWTFSGSMKSVDCPTCEYESLWMYDVRYAYSDQEIPADCSNSRIAEYAADPDAHTETLNTYSHLMGYTEEIPSQEGGVVMFGYSAEDGDTLAPYAAVEWNSENDFTWSRMGPNQVITERGQASISN